MDPWAPSLNGLNRVPLEPNRPANTHNELDHTVCIAHVIHLFMLCWIVGYIKCVWIFNSILTQWSFRSLKPSLFRTAIRVPLTFVFHCHGGWWHGDVLGSGIHLHYSYVIMGAMASQITSPTIVDSTVYSGADKKTSKVRVTGLCDRWIPRTKGQLRGKCFHLMAASCSCPEILRPQRLKGWNVRTYITSWTWIGVCN